MKNRFKYILGILVICCAVLVSCSKNETSQVLSGCYKVANNAEDGTEQPEYWYFKKDGTVLYCYPQVNAQNDKDTDFYYGDASRGTWKSLGNNKFQIKMHDVYDNDYYTIKGKVSGNKFHTYANSKKAKYSWSADTGTKISMTYSDYMDMFNRAKKSDQESIKENGYTTPDNDSSDSSDVSQEKIAVMIYQLCYPDDNISKEPEMGIYSYNGHKFISNGGSVTSVRFAINGDTVTYAKKSQGDYSNDQTISVKDLVKNYYSTSSQKSTVDSVASSLSNN